MFESLQGPYPEDLTGLFAVVCTFFVDTFLLQYLSSLDCSRGNTSGGEPGKVFIEHISQVPTSMLGRELYQMISERLPMKPGNRLSVQNGSSPLSLRLTPKIYREYPQDPLHCLVFTFLSTSLRLGNIFVDLTWTTKNLCCSG